MRTRADGDGALVASVACPFGACPFGATSSHSSSELSAAGPMEGLVQVQVRLAPDDERFGVLATAVLLARFFRVSERAAAAHPLGWCRYLLSCHSPPGPLWACLVPTPLIRAEELGRPFPASRGRTHVRCLHFCTFVFCRDTKGSCIMDVCLSLRARVLWAARPPLSQQQAH